MLTLDSLHQGAENCLHHISETTLPHSLLFVNFSHAANTRCCCSCCCGCSRCFAAFRMYPQEHFPKHREESEPLLFFFTGCSLASFHEHPSQSSQHNQESEGILQGKQRRKTLQSWLAFLTQPPHLQRHNTKQRLWTCHLEYPKGFRNCNWYLPSLFIVLLLLLFTVLWSFKNKFVCVFCKEWCINEIYFILVGAEGKSHAYWKIYCHITVYTTYTGFKKGVDKWNSYIADLQKSTWYDDR